MGECFYGVIDEKNTEMVTKRKINKGKYVIAFIISLSIFVIGILIGTLMTNNKFNSISQLQQELRTQVLTLETQYSIVSQNPCNSLDFPELTEELYKMSDNLDSLESQVGKNNENLLELIEYYSVLEIRHWLFLKEATKRCNINLNLILYFYSNDENKCKDCGVQGYVLTFLRKKYIDKNIYVYSFNTDLENNAVNTLVRLYNITKLPSVVINEKTYYGFKDRDEIERILRISS